MPTSEPSQPADRTVGLYVRIVVLFASMFTLLAGGAIAPALPGMRAYFSATPNVDILVRMQLSLTALFMAIGAALSGIVIDKIGRRPVMAGAIIMTAVFGASGYWADSLRTLLATRVLLGLAVGGVITAATTLVGDLFTGEQRTRFVALQSAAIKVGGIMFTLIGGVLASINWRMVFLVDLLALCILPGVLTHLTHEHSAPRLNEELDASRIPVVVAAVVLVAAFLGQIFVYVVPTQVPFLVMTLGGATPALVSYIIAGSMLAMAISASQYHRVRRHMGYYTIVSVSFLVGGLGYLASMFAHDTWTMVIALIVAGFGLGLSYPNTTSWLLQFTPQHLRGRAIGLLLTALFLGQFMSPLLFASTLARAGIRPLFGFIGTVLFALAAIFFVAALLHRRKDQVGKAGRLVPPAIERHATLNE